MRSYLFGQYLLEQGLVDADQLTEGLEYQRNNNKVLGELALEHGFLDRAAVARICEWQLCQDKDFGEIAVELGFLSQKQLKRLLDMQQANHQYLGQILVNLGHLSEAALPQELKKYRAVCTSEENEAETVEGYPGENPAGILFNLVTKILPRMTRGKALAGGYYPTIANPPFAHAFSQRLSGQLNLEAALVMPEELFAALGSLIVNNGWKPGKPGGSRRNAAAAKSLINWTLEIFAAKCEESGKKVALVDKPKGLSRAVYQSRRRKAGTVHCAEFFLLNPPDPKGDFLQFQMCLMFD